MFEIVISVAVYVGAVALLVKGAIVYCQDGHCHDNVITEP